MDFLTRIDNAFAWMRSNGLYRQAELYRRGESIFAKWGGGYVRLSAHGATSAPKVSWNEIDEGDLAIIDQTITRNPTYLGSRDAAPAVPERKTKRRAIAA